MLGPQRDNMIARLAPAVAPGLALVKGAIAKLAIHWGKRSRRFVHNLPASLEKVIPYWIASMIALGALKIIKAPIPPASFVEFGEIFVLYALLALAPTIGLRWANHVYSHGTTRSRLDFHLSPVGKWRKVDEGLARQKPEFGPYGLMACLMFGMLLNVPVRAFEFMLAVPAIHGAAPDWGRSIFLAMGLDVIAMSFLYVVCMVMALRSVPLFPRMLLAVWLIDITMQFAIASIAASHPSLPPDVAFALGELLKGNLTKVLISMVVWLPYLILSDRVNLTYRLRARAN